MVICHGPHRAPLLGVLRKKHQADHKAHRNDRRHDIEIINEEPIAKPPKGHLIDALIDPLRQGAALVIANRNAPEGYNEEDDKLIRHRKWFVQGLGWLVQCRWPSPHGAWHDVLHGMWAVTRTAFCQMNIERSGVTADQEMVRSRRASCA